TNNAPVDVGLYVRCYGAEDALEFLRSPTCRRPRGEAASVEWTLPATEGQPIFEVGLEIASPGRADGKLYLDWLTWDGAPDTLFKRQPSGEMWRRAWVNAADHVEFWGPGL